MAAMTSDKIPSLKTIWAIGYAAFGTGFLFSATALFASWAYRAVDGNVKLATEWSNVAAISAAFFFSCAFVELFCQAINESATR